MIKVGVLVRITDGLSKGHDGIVTERCGPSRIGVPMWRVDVIGHRVRTIREDWMRTMTPEERVRELQSRRATIDSLKTELKRLEEATPLAGNPTGKGDG